MVHLHNLCPITTTHCTYVFLSLANHAHIVGLASNVVHEFLWLQHELLAVGLLVQLTKCVIQCPHGLDHFISLPASFLIPNLGFCILGALVGSASFIESFMVGAFHEDHGRIFSFLMFVDLPTIFVMLSLCYALYNVSISRYFATLRQIPYLYHNYVGEVTQCDICISTYSVLQVSAQKSHVWMDF